MPIKQPIYDLGIIGGGIAGVAIARDAALRGLSVVLVEKSRLGSGTSGKSSRLIHGGIRYLDIAWNALRRGQICAAWKNFCFVLSALRECAILEKLAPDLIKPIPIIIPIYKTDSRNKFTVFLGVIVYFLLACLSGKAHFPRFYWTAKSVLKATPSLRPEGLVGGVQIVDRVTSDITLVQRIGASAKKAGARILEKTRVTSYKPMEFNQGFVIQSGKNPLTVRHLVNATGPWLDKIRRLGHEHRGQLITPIAGSHINLKKFLPVSVLLQAHDKDKRFFFCINTGKITRVGTTERKFSDPDRVQATDHDVQYLLRELNYYFPNRRFGKSDILSSDAGIRPLVKAKKTQHINAISREHAIVRGKLGVIHVAGVKLTDHRRAAEAVVNSIIDASFTNDSKIKRSVSTRQIPL